MNAAIKLVDTMSDEQRKEFLDLENQIKAMEARQKALVQKVKGVTFKTYETKSGQTGLTVHGLGKPQFFYKAHILALVGEGTESEQIRAKAREWIQQNDAVLSDKEE